MVIAVCKDHPEASIREQEKKMSKILEILSKDKDWQVRRRVAENLNTPIRILDKLSSDEIHEIKIAVAKNPKTTSKILEKLIDEDNPQICCLIVKHQNVTAKILTSLSRSNEWVLNGYIARNPKTPKRILDKLVVDHPQALSNWNLSRATLKKYLANAKSMVRVVDCLRNPQIDDELIQPILVNDDYLKSWNVVQVIVDLMIKGQVKPNKQFFCRFLDNPDFHFLFCQPSMRVNHFNILEQLITHKPSVEVCLMILQHPAATSTVQMLLSNHQDERVRWEVARLTEDFDILLKLCHDHCSIVCYHAVKRLKELNKGVKCSRVQKILESLCFDKSLMIRSVLAE